MRSPRSLHKRLQRSAAIAASLAVHVVLLAVLIWTRAPAPIATWQPPVDISLLPPLDTGLSSLGTPGGGGGAPGSPGSQLRRLDSPSASASAPASAGLRGASTPAQSPPAETALRAPTPQTVQASAAAKPTPAPELQPARSLAATQPVEEALPTLAARVQPLDSPLAAANRRTPSPTLRPAQTLAVDADRPVEALTQAVRPQQTPAVAAAAQQAATALRPAQTLAVEAERPAEALAQAARPQATPAVTAAARQAQAQALRPAQGLAVDDGRTLETLAARSQGPQATPTASAAARPGAPTQLQAAGGLAGPLSPAPPGSGAGQNPPLAGGPGPAGPARPGSGGSGASGAGAGAHPGCAREVLMLLTPAELAKCADPTNGGYRGGPSTADIERAKRLAAMRAVPQLSTLAPEKRAYYDAVADAKDKVYNQVGGGKAPGLACNLGALFGGKGGAPSARIKIPGLPCSFLPPVGVLTEEARISPP